MTVCNFLFFKKILVIIQAVAIWGVTISFTLYTWWGHSDRSIGREVSYNDSVFLGYPMYSPALPSLFFKKCIKDTPLTVIEPESEKKCCMSVCVCTKTGEGMSSSSVAPLAVCYICLPDTPVLSCSLLFAAFTLWTMELLGSYLWIL